MVQLTLQSWHRQFIKTLFHYSTERMNIEKAFMIKHPYVPNYLYKYRCFTDSHKKALEDNVLWTSAANSLNDPYDCAVSFDIGSIKRENISKEDLLKQIEQLENDATLPRTTINHPIQNPISHSDYINNIISEILSENPSPDNEKRREVFSTIFQKMMDDLLLGTNNLMRSGTGVLSLSETPLQHLMWSHYSNSFKGFVIEYDFHQLSYGDIARRLCFPVFYTKKPRNATRYLPKYIGAQFNNLFGSYTALMKSHEWSYEREWRILSMLGPDHATAPFAGLPKPNSIILGSQASEDDKAWITDFCCARNIQLKYLKENLKDRSLTITE